MAVGGFQPLPSAVFTVQALWYGIATLPLRNWAADYAWQLEQEQSKRRARELMVEFDEQLEQMDESTRLRVMDACSRQLEDEYREQKWREEVEAEQEWQRERRSILDGHDESLARREAAYEKWQEREREYERERERRKAEREQRRQEVVGGYTKLYGDLHEQFDRAKDVPDETTLRAWHIVHRRIAALAESCDIDPRDD